jgi:hypothetical protein
MKKQINLKPIQQTGHNCKPTAIAAVEKFFADQLGFQAIPLHKKKTALVSIRQLSKTKGSRQGELLEVRQLSEIFMDLGYKTELIDVQDNYDAFQYHVTENIKKGNLVIACFAVNRLTGLPSTHYERNNEHAAVLHGFNDETGELEITQWGKVRKTTMKEFYASSLLLPKQRKPEYYVNIKHVDKNRKYHLHTDQTGTYLPAHYKKSITPTPNSGFRGKLIVIKKPVLENILEVRKKALLSLELTTLFTNLKLTTNELIKKGNKKSASRNQYQDLGKLALQLNEQLDQAKTRFLSNRTINLDQFKQQCNTAIKAAENEFKKHRGWHQINLILRAILGVLSGLTIIPGIMIAVGARQGYIGTFFKTPKTNSVEKLELFKQNINNL